jgi:predicted nucleic acid-binding protein
VRPVLFDSSIYISALRKREGAFLTLRRLGPETPVWLSAVVLEELYAGADRRGRRVLEQLERNFDGIRRILVPNLGDWREAGKTLARVAEEFGYERIGQARLTNDALIAMSAARVGITVVTTNDQDFARLAQVKPFLWELTKIDE